MMKHQGKKIMMTKMLITTSLSFYITKPTLTTLHVPQVNQIETTSPLSKNSLPNLRILALGDSITFGFSSTTGNGYRAQLQSMLNNTFPSVTYIGSQSSGNMSNNVHEGYPGAVIHEIASKAIPSLAQQPNLILVMAGTNDVARPYEPDDAPRRLGVLIDSLVLNCPSSAIIAAQLPPITDPPNGQKLLEVFNAEIPEIIAVRQRAGKKVLLVDMSRGFSNADLQDGLHPNNQGYDKIANKWYSGTQQVSSFGWIQEPIPVNKGKGSLN